MITDKNNCREDGCYVASYTDANTAMDRFLRKVMLLSVVAAAIIISVFGAANVILASASLGTAKVTNTMPQMDATASPTPTSDDMQYAPKKNDQRTVLIDAGHGGFDPGTEGTWTGIFESDINLSIAFDVKELLESQNYAVLMTRTDGNATAAGKDDDMAARSAMIMRSDADIFVCIHQNAYENSETAGPEVYYHKLQPESVKLAKCVEKELGEIPNAAPSRGVKQYGHMLTKFMRYSILIECGFLTNQAEEAKLVSDEYQMKIAEAIVRGINAFYETEFEGA